MTREIFKSEGGSKYVGNLPFGCQLCMRGQKLVLFLGGVCSRPNRCAWYCPISNERKKGNLVYADEICVENPKDVFQEANLIKAMGCSFTGGDPLATEDHIELVIFYLEELKRKYSDTFHTHLYTNGSNFTPELAEKLAHAGLDEIRFHPAEEDFYKIEYAMDLGMQIGAEVPVIPTKENENYILNLIDYMDSIGADFVNLNEFEINEPNAKALIDRGFKIKENTIASVQGSEELAMKILTTLPDRYSISIHYCPISLKDGPQMRRRYKRRAESIRKPFEEVTEDGTLIFLRTQGTNRELQAFYNELLKESGVPSNMMELQINKKDESKSCLDLPAFLSEEPLFTEAIQEYNLKAGIVEALPFRGKYFEICEYTPIGIDEMNEEENDSNKS
jgi:pyruvate formate-lyase activating enzyme-like uncharacterized protein